MFWTGFLSVIKSLALYTKQQVYVIQVCWQLASRIRMEHPEPASKQSGKPV